MGILGKILWFSINVVLDHQSLSNFFKNLYLRIIADSRITALRIVCMMTSTIMWMMMSFLTETWKFEYTYAAGIRNIWSGLIIALPLILIHVSDIVTGDFYITSLGSILYSTGLGFLSVSTPANDCIGSEGPLHCATKAHTNLFTGLALTVCGLACIETSLSHFEIRDGSESWEDEVKNADKDCYRQNDTTTITCITSTSSLITTAFLGLLILIYANVIKSWHARLLIATVFVSLQSLNFIGGKQTYRVLTGLPKAPEKSLIVTILRVLVASTLKIGHPRVTIDQLYEGDRKDQLFNPPSERDDRKNQLFNPPSERDSDIESERIRRGHGDGDNDDNKEDKIWKLTSGMGWLDKAAIILEDQESEKQKEKRWRLCTLGEVEQTKMVLRMFPLWITCILLGVVSSIGDTYFLEQASKLDNRIGKLSVPLIILLGFQKVVGFAIASVFNKVTKKFDIRKIVLASLGIGLAMVFSVLCCVAAALIEIKRLKVVRGNHLVDKAEHDIPMSLFWLVPQFVLLGGLNSMFEQGNTSFSNRFPKRVVRNIALSTKGINGLGRIGGVLSVFLIGRITRGENEESWFESSLNKSRLDKYYWLLAAMSGIALAAYVIVAWWHFHREHSRIVGENAENSESLLLQCNHWCCN